MLNPTLFMKAFSSRDGQLNALKIKNTKSSLLCNKKKKKGKRCRVFRKM